MHAKNSEAQKCANTLGLLSNKSGKGNIDMNIVAKTDLNFQGIHLQPIVTLADIWLTASQIGFALQYADDKAVQRIYSRHADEFTANMTRVVKVTTPYGEQLTRAFSLRGAHLVAMFARTPKAKDFRRWVLDILDREAAQSPITKQFTDQELSDLAWLWRASDVMIAACESVYPLLRVAEHRQAGHFHSIGHEYPRTLNAAKELLKRETAHIEFQPWKDDNWNRVLPHLRRERLQ